jgi:hypothetical protein
MVGVYASSFSSFQMWMALAIGAFAFGLRRFGYPIVPMLMGVILGPYLEEFMRRSLIVSQGDPLVFITSPGSASIPADDACLHLAAADQAGNGPEQFLGRPFRRIGRRPPSGDGARCESRIMPSVRGHQCGVSVLQRRMCHISRDLLSSHEF